MFSRKSRPYLEIFHSETAKRMQLNRMTRDSPSLLFLQLDLFDQKSEKLVVHPIVEPCSRFRWSDLP